MQASTETIRITFEKSHLVTIGEKLYGESLELLRELIANAYDADATEVHVDLKPERLAVRDNGSGMDEEGLREFFRIGSQGKLRDPVSPRFRRRRVGQFGIGKFATLAACRRFRVFTQRNGFAAEAVFDKDAFAENDTWDIPLTRKDWNAHRGNGATVTLEELTKSFSLPEIERAIRERFPLDSPSFALFLNGVRIQPRTIPGRKFEVFAGTQYGEIRGELVLPNTAMKDVESSGIECTVRGIVICRTLFALDAPILQKMRGRIEADFLPITSDRSRFIMDTPEYALFAEIMQRELKKILRQLKDLEERKERAKADETLKDTLLRMRRAIRKNPDIAPPLLSSTGEIGEGGKQTEKMSPQAAPHEGDSIDAMQVTMQNMTNALRFPPGNDEGVKEPPPQKIRVKNLEGKDSIARKIVIGGIGITCALEHWGRESPAAFTDGGIVQINMDHPLYRKQQEKGKDMLGFYLSVLLARQVALLLAEGDTRKAFTLQERLLTDSW
ncbi:hypothetical protein A2765_06490 [Candidatus Kaiserbacteria bacterium RIFCSPHIGHO2_01_FULL_56_24]|uniref:ATP-binding protein n=1 Tax=Candidatus Kaiserbacteria bacterium RIFCSPHIGHO2_01_FULL_56_24 TaxID=1798487 RepID=A0A1F6DD14_9BACT|nr:MAG: hypothetical protein A2765_06490 [Candidatus Kaiserbacteria bacterium RIFCSPHIGHO2_01_FULL_56_24]